MKGAWLATLVLAVCTSDAVAQHDELGTPRATAPLTILQINDVYSTVPVDGAGGLARVAALERRLAAEGRTPIMMIAGDFLSSSVASTVFKGEQMIAALNAAGLDFATLGNHEFDFGVDLLIQRMREARWQWVVTNVLDKSTGQPIGGAVPFVIRTFGPLKVGVIGLCLTSEGMSRDRLERIQLIDPAEATAQYLPELKKQQVDVIVALTHLTFAEDRALAERFPEIDVIVGGHEHYPITAVVNRTLISKAGTDAKFVARIDINRLPSGQLERFYDLVPITSALPDEPVTAAVVDAYEKKLGKEMDTPVGQTRVALDGVAVRLRSGETNLGNLVADAMRAAARADIAIINAGGHPRRPHPPARSDLAPGAPRDTPVRQRRVHRLSARPHRPRGAERRGLAPARGRGPVSADLRHDDAGERAGGSRRPRQRGPDPGVPLDLDRLYTLAVPDYVLRGGDGYLMFEGLQVLAGAETGPQIVTALETYLASRGTVAPETEGRISIFR